MRILSVILLIFATLAQAQTLTEAQFISKTAFKSDALIAITQDSTFYFFDDESIIKKTATKRLSYSNLQLGEISSVNTFNPLKINVFYRNFNTAIILDNRLSEMYRVDFNMLEDYKNISHISTAADNFIWVFNENTQQLELFDHKTLKTKHRSLPITSEVEALNSNYNYCWLLTETHLYCFSYFGALVCKIEADDYDDLTMLGDNCILQKDDNLFYASKDTQHITPIQHKDVDIEQFFVTNQTLYIYDDDYIYNFKIK